MKRTSKTNFKFALRLAFERLELRQLLAIDAVIARPSGVNGMQVQIGTLPSFQFGKSSQTANPGGLFFNDAVDDILLAGDWSNYGYSNLGVARPNLSVNIGQITWEILLSTDADPHVDVNLLPKVQFIHPIPTPKPTGVSNTEVMYQLANAFAGDFDNQWGDEVALAFRLSVNEPWSWKINYGLETGKTSSWKYFIPSESARSLRTDRELVFGASDTVPVVGDFDGDGYSDLGALRHVAGSQSLGLSIAYGPDFAETRTKTIATNIDANALGGRLQLIAQRQADAKVRLSVLANGSSAEHFFANEAVAMNRANEALNINFSSRNQFGTTARADQILVGNWAERAWTRPTIGLGNTWLTSNWSIPKDTDDVTLDGWDDATLSVAVDTSLNRIGSTIARIPLTVSQGSQSFLGRTDLSTLRVSGGSVELASTETQVVSLEVTGSGLVTISGSAANVSSLTVGSGGVVIVTDTGVNLGSVTVLPGGELRIFSPVTVGSYNQTGGVLDVLTDEALGNADLVISGGTVRSTIPQSTKANLRLSNPIQLSNTVTLETQNDSYLVLAGAISGSGVINKTGAGFVFLPNGTGTHNGNFSIQQGTLIHDTSSLMNSIVLNSGVLELYGPGGASTDVDIVSGTLVVHEAIVFDRFTIRSGTHRLTNSLTASTLDVQGGSVTIASASSIGTIDNNGGTLVIDSSVGTGGTLRTRGNARTLISAPQSFSTVEINSGTVQIDYSARVNPLGNATTSVSITNGSLLSNIPVSLLGAPEKFVLRNSIAVNGVATIGNINDIQSTAALNYLDFSGVISGAGSLRKVGIGSALLTGSNTYSGITTVDDGELIAASNNALGATGSGVQVNGTGSSPRLGLFGNVLISEPISVATGGRLDLRGAAVMAAPLTLNANSSLLVENGTTVSGLVTLNGNGNINFDSIAPVGVTASPLPAVISGQITGTSGLTLNTRLGLALQLSNSTNNYLGNTRVAGTGRAQLGGTQAIPSVGSLTVDTGASLSLNGFSQSTQQLLGGGRIDLGGGELNVDSGNFAGVIAGAGNVRKSSTGTLTLTGVNVFTGSLEIVAGTLTTGGVATLPTVPLSISLGATLDLLGNSQQVGSISGNGNVRGTGGTLIVSGTANVRFDGTLSGAIGIRKQGSGAWTLGAANSFTGGMQVNAGSLLLEAVNALGSGSLTISSGATVDMLQNQQVTTLSNSGTVRANAVTLRISGNLSNTSTATFENTNGTVQTTGTSGEQTLNFGTARPGNLTIAGGSRVNLQASTESITLAGSLNMLAGTLDLNTKVVTTNALTLDGNATLSGTGQLTSNSVAQLISGVVGIALAGPSGVRKSGSGTVTINTAGVYRGPTTVEQGTLDVQVSQGLGEGGIDVRTSGVLLLQGTHSLSQLDNTGRVTAPSATIQLAGNLTNTGSLALGTLETVGSSGTTQQVQLGSGNLDNLTSVDAADVQVSSLAPTLNLSGSLIVQGGSINLGDEVVSAGRVVINGNNTKEIRGTGSLTSGSAFDLQSGVVAIALRGSSGLTKSTAGTVTLLVGNSFTGPIAIQAGTLIASAPNSIAGTVSTTQGATLDIRGTQGPVSLQNAGRLIANSASLQLNGNFINAGDFQSGTSTLVLNSNGPQTINLGASRAHSITKQGSGVASLQSSDNAVFLTGDLTLEQGRMNLGSSVAVSRSFSLDGGSTIEGTGSLTSSSDFTLRSGTVAVALSGSGGIRKASSGTVTLQVPNALTGSTIVIDNGILNAIASNSLPTGNLQLAASSTLGVSGTQTVQSIDNLGTINAGTSTIQTRGDFSSPGIFNAASSTLVMNGTGEQRVQFGDNRLNNLTIAGQSNVVRLVSAATTLNLTGSLNVRSGSLEADNTAVVSTSFLLDAGNSDTIRGTSTLSSTSTFDLRNGTVEIELMGTAGLRKSSTGTVRLNVSASYQGDSQVIEGSLLLNTPNAIPAQSPIKVGASGSVDFGNFSADINSITNQGNVQVGEAELSLTNDLINESSGTFTTGTTTLNLNGNLLNQGSWPSAKASITWEGTSESQRLFSNNATFSNLVKSSVGELIVEDLASVEGEYRQLSGDLRLAAGDLSVGTFVWNQGELNSDSTAQTFGINIRNSATFEAGNLNAPIQGGSVWTKVGSGVVTFSAPIAYDLQLQVDGGEVNVTQNASLPEKRDLSIASSAILRVQSGSTTFANVDIAGDLLVGTSTLVVQPIARINQTVAESSVVTGTVSGSSGLLKLGLGTLTWSGVNQITGVYEIDGGNFELMSNSALASESSLVVNGLAKVKVVGSNVGNSSLSGEGELSVDTRSQVVTRGGSFSGVLSGAGNIIKQGQDNLELTSLSRSGFNGNLRVQAGSLIVNGDLSSAKTNVENGASLRGAGRLGETIILRGGTLSPGNSPGRMTLASLDLEPGASLVVELEGRQAGETYDQLVVVGDARLDGNWVVEIDQTLRGSLSPVDFFDLVTFQTMSGTPSLSFPTDLGNLAIRPLVLANSYRLIVEAPTPPPNGSGQNPTDDSEDADSPKDEGNGTTRLVGVANREERVNSIILSVSKKDVGSNKQYSHAGDPSDTLVPPISKVISEADAAVAAIDKVLADGVSMEEAPAVIADVKPIRIDELEIPEFPKPSSIDRKVEFPEWIEADQTNSTRRIVAVASGITTTLIGLGLAWFAYRRTKQSQGREQELEHTSIGQPLNRSNTGSPSKKTESSNSNAKEDTLWTNS